MPILETPIAEPILESHALQIIIFEDDMSTEVLSNLTPDDFSIPVNRDLFLGCCECFKKHGSVNLISLAASLDQKIAKNGLYSLLVGLNELWVATPRTIVTSELRKLHILRKMKQLKLSAKTVEEGIAEVEKTLQEYYGLLPSKNVVPLDELEALFHADDVLLSTGFGKIDDLTGGMRLGQMVVVGARTSKGKSTLLMNIAANVALIGEDVLYISLEMGNTQNVKRFVRFLSQKESCGKEETKQHLERIAKVQLADSCFTLSQIEAATVSAHPKLVVVDYLQLIRGDRTKYESKVAELEEITRRLKLMAEREHCCVLTAAQLNRDLERVNREPKLVDLRGCGSIEQDADTVLLLHSDEPNDEEGKTSKWETKKIAKELEGKNPNDVKVIVAKNREGQTGVCYLTFKKPLNTFCE